MTLVGTTQIAQRAIRKDSAEAFFSVFPKAWDAVRCQVLKLETKQLYQEHDNPAWKALQAGDTEQAARLIPEVRSDDVGLYSDLKRREVEFLRCRPLVFPLSPYMRWEMEVYKFNAAHGERIFCCNRRALDSIFDQQACHDFMVFDARFAFIHDYDDQGLVRGGWHVEDQADIRALIGLFGFIKANCQPYHLFLPS